MPDPKKQLTKAVLLTGYKWVTPFNSRNQIQLNPLVYSHFKAVSPTAHTHITAYFLDEAETELGLFWADHETSGAIKVHESNSEGTARIYLGLLVAKYPALKVEPGRERPFPAKISSYEHKSCLVIDVSQIDSVPKESKRKPKADTKPADGKQQTVSE